jgi:hypothetical protein
MSDSDKLLTLKEQANEQIQSINAAAAKLTADLKAKMIDKETYWNPVNLYPDYSLKRRMLEGYYCAHQRML